MNAARLAAAALLWIAGTAAGAGQPPEDADLAAIMRACASGCAVLTTADADKLDRDMAAMRATVQRLVREAEKARREEAARVCS